MILFTKMWTSTFKEIVTSLIMWNLCSVPSLHTHTYTHTSHSALLNLLQVKMLLVLIDIDIYLVNNNVLHQAPSTGIPQRYRGFGSRLLQ